jgi:hypothetical protein
MQFTGNEMEYKYQLKWVDHYAALLKQTTLIPTSLLDNYLELNAKCIANERHPGGATK